jgi:hypothetical protein
MASALALTVIIAVFLFTGTANTLAAKWANLLKARCFKFHCEFLFLATIKLAFIRHFETNLH